MTLATFDDANGWLDGTKISFANANDAEPEATEADAIVKAALTDLYPANVPLWDATGTPELTPKVVRQAAALLMAAYRYSKRYSEESVGPSTFGMLLEARANGILAGLRNGSLSLDDKTYTSQLGLTEADFWPNNTTVATSNDDLAGLGLNDGDPLRMFTMNKEF